MESKYSTDHSIFSAIDCVEVMRTCYGACKAIAQKLTDTYTMFSDDHIIRESGVQVSAGGIDGSQRKSGVASGGL